MTDGHVTTVVRVATGAAARHLVTDALADERFEPGPLTWMSVNPGMIVDPTRIGIGNGVAGVDPPAVIIEIAGENLVAVAALIGDLLELIGPKYGTFDTAGSGLPLRSEVRSKTRLVERLRSTTDIMRVGR